MNSRIVDTSSSLLSTKYIIYMALFLWGLAWFAMSVVIFALGWILPQLRSKPPPTVVKPRSPHIPSEPLSPVTATTDLISLGKDDAVSTESTPSDLPSPPPAPSPPLSSPTSSKRTLFKSRWSFPGTRKSSRPSSRKSSVGSAGSLTPVDKDSSYIYVPDLEVIGSESGAEVGLGQNTSSFNDPSPSDSPRPARNVRTQSLKLLKNLSRKVSSKQRAASVPSPLTSPVVPIVPLADESCKPVKQARRSQSRERPVPSTLVHSDELRPTQRVDPLSGEVFTTTFVNPFRIKPRKPKPSLAPINPSSSSSSSAPTSRRASGPRRMLNSLHLTLANNPSHASVGPTPDSPRSSISSASTSTFSASSSVRSALSGSSGSPRGVRRTQPYAAPYYAAMPGPAGTGSGTSARRRAASCSREWRPEPEPVEEEGEDSDHDANALGLEFASPESEFGQMRRRKGSTPLREVQTEPHRGRNGAGHRAAASESGVVLGSAR